MYLGWNRGIVAWCGDMSQILNTDTTSKPLSFNLIMTTLTRGILYVLNKLEKGKCFNKAWDHENLYTCKDSL